MRLYLPWQDAASQEDMKGKKEKVEREKVKVERERKSGAFILFAVLNLNFPLFTFHSLVSLDKNLHKTL